MPFLILLPEISGCCCGLVCFPCSPSSFLHYIEDVVGVEVPVIIVLALVWVLGMETCALQALCHRAVAPAFGFRDRISYSSHWP